MEEHTTFTNPIPKQPKGTYNLEFWMKTIRMCLIVIILIMGSMITLSTLYNQNTYCKTMPKIYGETRYTTKEMLRQTEPGFTRTHYGLGTLIIENQTIIKGIDCKTKFLKFPLNNPSEIKEYIFNETD